MNPTDKIGIALTSAGIHLADLFVDRIDEKWYIRGYTKEGLTFSALMPIESHVSQISARIREDLYE